MRSEQETSNQDTVNLIKNELGELLQNFAVEIMQYDPLNASIASKHSEDQLEQASLCLKTAQNVYYDEKSTNEQLSEQIQLCIQSIQSLNPSSKQNQRYTTAILAFNQVKNVVTRTVHSGSDAVKLATTVISQASKKTPNHQTNLLSSTNPSDTPLHKNSIDSQASSEETKEESVKTSHSTDANDHLAFEEPEPETTPYDTLIHKTEQLKARLEDNVLTETMRNTLYNQFQPLLLAVQFESQINVYFETLEQAIEKNHTRCFIYDNSNLIYVSRSGACINLESNITFTFEYYFSEQIKSPEGMSPSYQNMEKFLSVNDVQMPAPIVDKINDLNQKLDIALAEIDFHQAYARLQEILRTPIEYPGCLLYFMPIPSADSWHNYSDCYIWDEYENQLVYVSSNQLEYVTLNDVQLFKDNIRYRQLEDNRIFLSGNEAYNGIENNGGHRYNAKIELESLLQTQTNLLNEQSTTFKQLPFGSLNLKQKLPKELEENSLYLHIKKDNQIAFSIKCPPPETLVQAPRTMVYELADWLLPSTNPTNIIEEDKPHDYITGIKTKPINLLEEGFKNEVLYAINHSTILSEAQETKLWDGIRPAIQTQMRHLKNAEYARQVHDLAVSLHRSRIQLQSYLNNLNRPIQECIANEQEQLQKLLGHDLFRLVQIPSTEDKATLALYRQSIHILKHFKEHKTFPRLTRLTKAIQIHIIARKQNNDTFDFQKDSMLPLSELPPLLRRLNTPISLPQQYTPREINFGLLILGLSLIAASTALFLLSHGLSSPLSFAGFSVGIGILATATFATTSSGILLSTLSLFAGKRQPLPIEQNNPLSFDDLRVPNIV